MSRPITPFLAMCVVVGALETYMLWYLRLNEGSPSGVFVFEDPSAQATKSLRSPPTAGETIQAVEVVTVRDEYDGVWARAFDALPAGREVPCPMPEENWKDYTTESSPADTGLLFLKPYKTGSSTASGINLRISRNTARRRNKEHDMCRVRFDHAWASSKFPTRDRDNSFLWTLVRDPTKRVVSQFFHFEISRDKKEPTDDNFFNYVINGPNGMVKDYYLGALSISGYKEDRSNNVDVANGIMGDYDFIGVTERMDESVVALAMILEVPLADVLYLKAKGKGGFDDGGGRDREICTYIWPSFVSDGMKEFFETEQWRDIIRWDEALYKAANRSLDLTIDKLGRKRFEENLKLYLHAKVLVFKIQTPKR